MKESIVPANGPAAAGPYSPALRASGLIFVSGQIPVHPGTGEIVRGSIQDQLRQTFENVKAILQAAGSSMEKVIKCNVYLKRLDFEALNEAYSTYFSDQSPPARTTIGVADLPKSVDVEIDVIALE